SGFAKYGIYFINGIFPFGYFGHDFVMNRGYYGYILFVEVLKAVEETITSKTLYQILDQFCRVCILLAPSSCRLIYTPKTNCLGINQLLFYFVMGMLSFLIIDRCFLFYNFLLHFKGRIYVIQTPARRKPHSQVTMNYMEAYSFI